MSAEHDSPRFGVSTFRTRITGTRAHDQIQALENNFKVNGPKVLRAICRLVATSCARETQPSGFGENAKKKGEHATASDIARLYVTPTKVANTFPDKSKAKAFLSAMARRNYTQAQQIVTAYHPTYRGVPVKPFDQGTAHKAARNSYGRVPANKRPVMILTTPRNFFAYLKREVDHVGEGKAGWAACARALGGTRDIPQWVTRHAGRGPSSGSGVVENYSGSLWRVRMTSTVPYATKILDPGAKQRAIAIGYDRYVLGKAPRLVKAGLTIAD